MIPWPYLNTLIIGHDFCSMLHIHVLNNITLGKELQILAFEPKE